LTPSAIEMPFKNPGGPATPVGVNRVDSDEHVEDSSDITADALLAFIRANVEQIGGRLVCRASVFEELRRRGVERPKRVRTALVKELERRGLVNRPDPRSRWLILLERPRREGTFTADVERTRARVSRLQAYMRRNVLNGRRFVCAHWSGCAGSIHAGCTFTEGQLSHVGKNYDLLMGDEPLRIVVVGQEVGGSGHARVTLDERYRLIHEGSGLEKRFSGDRVHGGRNPHMRGTTLALRAIFGSPGTDHETEFLDMHGERVHLFDCFALVNRLLCSAHVRGTSTGQPTPTMFDNCERHFAATLEILQPTIVVIQGVQVWKRSQRVLVPRLQLSEHLVECELAGQRVLVSTFAHPSARGEHRWAAPDSPYLIRVVRPTLQMAMDHLPVTR